MNLDKLRRAIDAADVFLARAIHVRDHGPPPEEYIVGTKETGALRRASMELTRALAELRRPQR